MSKSGKKSVTNAGNDVVTALKPVTYSSTYGNYSNYGNYSKKTTTNVAVFNTNTPGIDGTPYKDSPLYFGDKTKPYDSFYDYSDDLSRLYLGYIALKFYFFSSCISGQNSKNAS